MAPSVFASGSGRGGGGFAAAWQGSLIAPERDEYTFSMEGAGTVTLRIDGQTVLSGALPLRATVPVTLGKGAHAIYCSYRSPRDGEARCG